MAYKVFNSYSRSELDEKVKRFKLNNPRAILVDQFYGKLELNRVEKFAIINY